MTIRSETSDRTWKIMNPFAVSVYSGSCQELNPFCHVQEVIECIKGRVRISEEAGSEMIVMPFTMWVNKRGQLNEDCITKPLKWLKGRGIKDLEGSRWR
ncbi:MAG: hypothetical protein LYZ69_03680 [Nitrososphaerales archaeon]|nr:hypothetical protein [Nitrososphaerales archaeon]